MSGTEYPGPSASTIPHCYRHPDRETYISCQRCARPICPDCMRQASVGFQCPDCVRAGAATMPQTRTRFGGRATGGPPIVTYALIAVNVVFFVIANATNGINGSFVQRMSLIVDADFPRAGIEGVAQGSYWQLITSTFLHTQILHIAMNMFGVYLFGSFLEQLLGRWRFLALYLLSGLVGSVAVYLLTGPTLPGQPLNYSLGASGSVFGLFGAALLVLMKQRGDVTQLLVLLVLNLAFTFAVPSISWQAHVGGLLAGLAMGAGFAYAPRQQRLLIHVAMIVALSVVCAALVVLRTAQLA